MWFSRSTRTGMHGTMYHCSRHVSGRQYSTRHSKYIRPVLLRCAWSSCATGSAVVTRRPAKHLDHSSHRGRESCSDLPDGPQSNTPGCRDRDGCMPSSIVSPATSDDFVKRAYDWASHSKSPLLRLSPRHCEMAC
jgi:hypothetical protein